MPYSTFFSKSVLLCIFFDAQNLISPSEAEEKITKAQK